MKHLVGKKITDKVKFMGEKVDVRRLTLGEVRDLRKKIKKAKPEDEEAQTALIKDIIRTAVVGADELTDEDFDTFPLQELVNLSEAAINVVTESGNAR